MSKHLDNRMALVIAAVALIALPWFVENLPSGGYLLHVIVLILLYAYLSTVWNILGGYAGQHSLGHGIFLGVGAYVSSLLFLKFRMSPWLGMWPGALAGALVALAIGYLCFRYGLKGPYFALATIALAEAMLYLVVNIGAVGGASGLEIPWVGDNWAMMQFGSKTGYYYVALALAVAGIAITRWLSRHRLGYYMVSVRENEDAAAALGVDVMRTKVQATVLSAFLTAIGGTFYAQYFAYINPRTVFGEGPSIQILLFSIIGGLGTVWGPTVGAVLLVPLGEYIRARLGGSFAGVSLLLYGTILVIVMLFMPKGLVGVGQNLWHRLSRKRRQGGK